MRASLRVAILPLFSVWKRQFGACRLAFLTAAAGLSSSVLLADTIYLKNGRKIIAPVTREDTKQIFYERGGGEFAIPRSLVDRIEKSSVADAEATSADRSSPAGSSRDLPLPAAPVLDQTADLPSKAIKNSAIDEAYLQALDNEFLRNSSPENRRALTQGYQDAAIFLTRKGDPENAIGKYRHALKFAPEDQAVTIALGYLLVKQSHHQEAIDLLAPAVVRNPKDADLHLLLGSAYYATERQDRALEEWNKALVIGDNPRIRAAIARVEREQSRVGSFSELRSEHFLLRYEGQGTKALGEEVLKALEADFRELESDLDVYPRDTIVVHLFTNQDFRDITRSASWVGALNDGKIRVPVSGLSTVTPGLNRVLKHELTHSFVRQVTLGRCPVWFNEGLAQIEEGETTASLGAPLARVFRHTPPYSSLETTFMELQPDVVGVAYAKSLAGVEYLRATYGLGEIRRLLKALSANPSFSSLLQGELRLTYPAFDDAVASYLEKRYGP